MKKIIYIIFILLILTGCGGDFSDSKNIMIDKNQEKIESELQKKEPKIKVEKKVDTTKIDEVKENTKNKKTDNDKEDVLSDKTTITDYNKINAINSMSYDEKYKLDCDKISNNESIKNICYDNKLKEVFLKDFLYKIPKEQYEYDCNKFNSGNWKKIKVNYFERCTTIQKDLKNRFSKTNNDFLLKREKLENKFKNKDISVCNDLEEKEKCKIKMGLDYGCDILGNNNDKEKCLRVKNNLIKYDEFLEMKDDYKFYNDYQVILPLVE